MARRSIYPVYYPLSLEYLSFWRKILLSSWGSSTAWMESFDNWFIRRILYQQTIYRKHIQATHNTFIEILMSNNECNMEELPPKLVPIPLIEQTFRVDISDILPKDKRPRSNKKAVLSVKRRALPLVPTYCSTTHKSQGQTLSKVVIDLKLPNETDGIAAVCVPLSRVKRLTELVILRHFDYKVLLIKPSKPQVAEMERLDKLYLETQTRFAEWFWSFLSVVPNCTQRCRWVALLSS